MTGLEALTREIRIAWYRWALRNMGPLHRDVPEVVLRLYALEKQRQPVDMPRIRCTRSAQWAPGLHHEDGGHTFAAGVVFPIEPETRP